MLENSFCKSRSHMAALANPPEAKYSHVDSLSFMFSPQPNENLALHVKILTLASLFHDKTLFRFEPSLN